MTTELLRHRALAGISRSRLLAVLERATEPMPIGELARAVDLHPNTAREHLDRLVAVGLVIREKAAPAGRGRPGLRYSVAPEGRQVRRRAGGEAIEAVHARETDARAFRALAGALADELSRRPDATAAAVRAGTRWGRSAIARRAVPASGDAVGRLVDLLDDSGFAPERSSGAGDAIRLRRCPFGSLAHSRRDVVCGVHLGLMQGALEELGEPFGDVRLEPFVRPDLCLAHVPR